jgi:hypothetical protein
MRLSRVGFGSDVEMVRAILMLKFEPFIASIDIISIDAIVAQQPPPEGRLAAVLFPCGFCDVSDAI